LLEKWKNVNKALKSGIINESDLRLTSSDTFKGDVLTEISQILRTKKDEAPKKVQKFYSDWTEAIKKIEQTRELFSNKYIEDLINKSQN